MGGPALAEGDMGSWLLLLLGLWWEGEWTQSLKVQRREIEQAKFGFLPPGYPRQDKMISIQVPKLVTVQEGLCVLVPCSFSFPWTDPDSGGTIFTYWFWVGDDEHQSAPVATNNQNRPEKPQTQGRFFVTREFPNNCSLAIEGARKEDQAAYFFRVERGNDKYSYKDKKLNLQVTALTSQPDIQLGEPLVSGHPTNLTCILAGSCEGTAPKFFWEGDALDSLDPRSWSSSVISFTPRAQDHGRNLTCRVTVPGAQVSTQRTIRLNVTYAPQFLTITMSQGSHTVMQTLSNHTSLAIQEGQSLHLVCEAEGNPPARLSWSLDGRALSPPHPAAPGVLELPRVGPEEEGEFTCLAQNLLGAQHLSFCLSLQRSPHPCTCTKEEQQQGSWPLILTLLRGGFMGAGFLLTYGLTWLYYTRCPGSPRGQN